ncbi:hypothetical protein [Streptomyces asiaticus]
MFALFAGQRTASTAIQSHGGTALLELAFTVGFFVLAERAVKHVPAHAQWRGNPAVALATDAACRGKP